MSSIQLQQSTECSLLGRSNGYAVVRLLVRSCGVSSLRQNVSLFPAVLVKLFSAPIPKLISTCRQAQQPQCLMNVPYAWETALPIWWRRRWWQRRRGGQELRTVRRWQTMDTCRRTTASLLRCWSGNCKHKGACCLPFSFLFFFSISSLLFSPSVCLFRAVDMSASAIACHMGSYTHANANLIIDKHCWCPPTNSHNKCRCNWKWSNFWV